MYSHSQKLASWIAVGYGIIKIWQVLARTSNRFIGAKGGEAEGSSVIKNKQDEGVGLPPGSFLFLLER